ncbi:MAG TPA: 50S ribosomal protein L1 [Lentisphaeria bacterium]|nr:MAG: 50S ribosomal protein L1 [Lentisphaerae bacterium GWF2_38_69]HBM15469.1 50S ribosomal protein L1 [Lentisphaeria bacterium]
MHRSKLYRSQIEKVERAKLYDLKDAFTLLKSLPHVKFDETVELALKLGIDTKQSDQTVRGAVTLPSGTGKKVTVAVVASGDAAEKAKAAGADFVGYEDLIEKIKGGWLEFDSLITTPGDMPKLRALGKVLGPKGLMPNPKTGTVTDNLEGAVREAKAGKVEFRADKGGVAHVPVGKLSFTIDQLDANIRAIINAITSAKPSGAKGTYLISATISSTMSPGIKISLKDFIKVVA